MIRLNLRTTLFKLAEEISRNLLTIRLFEIVVILAISCISASNGFSARCVLRHILGFEWRRSMKMMAWKNIPHYWPFVRRINRWIKSLWCATGDAGKVTVVYKTVWNNLYLFRIILKWSVSHNNCAELMRKNLIDQCFAMYMCSDSRILFRKNESYVLKLLGAVSIRKTVLPGMTIPMLKIRRPNGRLIFNMEIAIRR